MMLGKCGFGKQTLLLIVLSALTFPVSGKQDSVSAQKEYSNSIILSGTDYYSEGTFRRLGILFFWQDQQVGIYYQRKINKHIRVKVGYNEWNSFPWRYHKLFSVVPDIDTMRPGTTLQCVKYKMVDACLLYVYNGFKKHKISLGLGASYTWGMNSIIDSITVYPGYYDAIIFQHGEKKSYYGIVPSVSYDYLFFKNRLMVGADIRYRKYFGFYLNTFEYGIHVGFNF